MKCSCTNRKRESRSGKIVRMIRENVDDLYANRVDHETFSKRNRALWVVARQAGPGIERRVQRAIANRVLETA